jgi:hypothetical protein
VSQRCLVILRAAVFCGPKNLNVGLILACPLVEILRSAQDDALVLRIVSLLKGFGN